LNIFDNLFLDLIRLKSSFGNIGGIFINDVGVNSILKINAFYSETETAQVLLQLQAKGINGDLNNGDRTVQ